ncbi:salt tolerance-like protein [Musa troglodytarum]|uniref:Salt tolerance-like protein n=1 Tax=Musa troglodytarum TaxID=320322 RepID=A0A9E7EVD0_9LILI|nr:salt tolerance-like protein [Musa troglodytarum]URD83392.1 salt tolerance-like protein [Musa troglodytarum]
MKIQCDVCERAAAAVLCCADEAALCWSCDEKVHAANKLAGKHQRVRLLPTNPNAWSSQIPNCDICQEKAGYFFCLEDRALLCRQCDVVIHTASPYVSSHQRFLITGLQVALQHHLTNGGNKNSSSDGRLRSPVTADSIVNQKLQAATSGSVTEEGSRPPWPWNEILGGFEFDQCHGLSEPVSPDQTG